MATFQVSEAFYTDLKSVLEANDICTKELVKREQELVKPPQSITSHIIKNKTNVVKTIQNNIDFNVDALGNGLVQLVRVVGKAALAGHAVCNVM